MKIHFNSLLTQSYWQPRRECANNNPAENLGGGSSSLTISETDALDKQKSLAFVEQLG